MLLRRIYWYSNAIAAAALIAAAISVIPSNYVVYHPGPTVDMLGKFAERDIIEVNGAKTHPHEGELRMITVIPSGPDTHVNLYDAIWAWLDPDVGVLPWDTVYQEGDGDQNVREESTMEMQSSQDNAIAAALTALGHKFTTRARVAGVDADGPSAGKLKAGDVILRIDGDRINSVQAVVERIRAMKPGAVVTLDIRRPRKGKAGQHQPAPLRTIKVKTGPAPDDPTKARIGITVAPQYRFPFDVKINLPEQIGGPSAGMMMALSVYDVLTPGSLAGKHRVAGTAVVNAAGRIGPIGAINQKIVAAERDGAELFLMARDNCDELSREAPDGMRLVPVETLQQAVSVVKRWTNDPSTRLPQCPAG